MAAPGKLVFHYIKSNEYRVIHVDGAVGSPSPSGKGIFVALFSEHNAIPQSSAHELLTDGKISDPSNVVTRGGIVREIEIGIHMDLDTASALKDWLATNLDAIGKVSQ